MSERTAGTVLDEYLVLQSQVGDSDAFGLLVQRWHARLVRHALRYTHDSEAAQDAAREAWLGIVRGLASLGDPALFRPWAFRIVANKAHDWIRREQSRRRAAQGVGDTVQVADGAAAASDAVCRVRDGIDALDANHRLILSWFYVEETSIKETAAALSIPVGTVKSRLYHARNALRDRLEEE